MRGISNNKTLFKIKHKILSRVTFKANRNIMLILPVFQVILQF
jgi:hypothetical protein